MISIFRKFPIISERSLSLSYMIDKPIREHFSRFEQVSMMPLIMNQWPIFQIVILNSKSGWQKSGPSSKITSMVTGMVMVSSEVASWKVLPIRLVKISVQKFLEVTVALILSIKVSLTCADLWQDLWISLIQNVRPVDGVQFTGRIMNGELTLKAC